MLRLKTIDCYLKFSPCNNREILLRTVNEFLPNWIFNIWFNLRMNIHILTRRDWKSIQNLVRTTLSYITIGSFYFCPNLLKQNHPYLLIVGFAKYWTICVSIDGNVIIYYEFSWGTSNVYYNFVNSIWIYCRTFEENIFNSWWDLG